MKENGYKVLFQVYLAEHHKPTGNVRAIIRGKTAPVPVELRIAQMEDDPGVYLLHYNNKGEEITDTYHDSVELAMEQAEFEFGVGAQDWRQVDHERS